jgi:hypothetical protein
VKEANKRWCEANPEKVKIMNYRKIKEATNYYVKKILKQAGIPNPPARLIDAKRQQLFLNRTLKHKGDESCH